AKTVRANTLRKQDFRSIGLSRHLAQRTKQLALLQPLRSAGDLGRDVAVLEYARADRPDCHPRLLERRARLERREMVERLRGRNGLNSQDVGGVRQDLAQL